MVNDGEAKVPATRGDTALWLCGKRDNSNSSSERLLVFHNANHRGTEKSHASSLCH